jgi:nitrile hydratase subunit beta
MMPVVDLDFVRNMYKNAGAIRLELDIAPRFEPGDHVMARNINPPGHTRLPRYIHNKKGVVERDHGVFHFPDTRVAGQGDQPQHLYSVRFTAQEVWGDEAPAKDSLSINLWDDYMDPA